MTIQFQESGIPQSEDFNVSETRSERILGYALCARAPPSVPCWDPISPQNSAPLRRGAVWMGSLFWG